ncbi:MAG TPA: polyribonucleotide nucleotidyltransferase [Anaerolineaceae bacterium]|nr:polyribonucleotide nucleotidyltransferase [Anaerolineaceae bacterium]HQF45819.1 polyribonucleotide nucleotidyltransferase [Anaerolineaceae bacterium]HQH35582.1 polyribonucleotide nucleotidyltransferase [Anaerolineaceae bacterium]HQJ03332.1 polyribonucleotide nucleotidyltransferase [Anaerolineaceae bacterium]HQL39851.1 polyribonucleotide nucleotidyltransferase [Anaerolineaceae bacterium]
MQPQNHIYTTTVGGRPVTFESGKLAHQAGGSVTVRLGDSIVFAAATMSAQPRDAADFFPLTVEYEERLYAGGRIPGSYFRREGRPGEDAILVARLTDRPIRPLFNKDIRNEVQVIMFSLSADPENPLDILAVNAASAALMISDIPWAGPVGAVRVARVDGQFIVNPTFQQMEVSDLDLRIAGTSDAILMVECGAIEIPEDVMVEALMLGHQSIQSLVELQKQMAAELGKPKREVPTFPLDASMLEKVTQMSSARIHENLDAPHDKAGLSQAMQALEEEIIASIAGEDEALVPAVKQAFEEAYKQVVRSRIVESGKRPDGRTPTEIRPIWCEVNISPRAHGSGLFTRGETQVLTLATLGTPKEAQELDNLSPNDSKRYIHHYNFPPYSTGEVKMLRGSSRREIGHGALAERALIPVIPPEDEFPYTLRLVSEVLASNGSSSMASVCGSTLALMDCGVPIKAPVTGVAMGLVKEGDRYTILTDIQGLEDHLGDMDFKVAGTTSGITALQMDIKIKGITAEIMSKALAQAREARLFIMDKLLEVIPAPRPEMKPHAPRITILKVPVDKIGAIIGPGGKIIRGIQEETGVKIDIDDDGTVYIAAVDGVAEAKAREKIESLVEIPQIGRIYTGKVVRIAEFGAFVEILPGTDGLVHISQLDSERVNKVEDVVSMGDEISVMITGIDDAGKIRLSRQAVLEGWSVEEAQAHDRGGRPSGGGSRPGGSGGRRDDRRGNDRGGDRGGFRRR